MTYDQERQKKLVMEAFYLSQDIAKTDKRIESYTKDYNGFLMNWVEGLDTPAKFSVEKGLDKVVDKAFPVEEKLKKAFEFILKGIGVAQYAGVTAGVVVRVFSPIKNDNAKAKFYDDNSRLATDYENKKKRLQQIYNELFLNKPPSYNLHTNICGRERCLRSN